MPQSQTAHIVFAKDEQPTLPQNIIDTLGNKEEIQKALANSENTLNLVLNNCSEQEIQKLDIDESIKQELIIMRRQKDLNLMRKHKNIELER